MNELHAIFKQCNSVAGAKDAVLATVVHVRGSAYRRPGARMLILPDGGRIGSISGGCLEGEISKKAWWFTESGKPVVRVYDTTSDEDAAWEFGLGCNGVVQVMLERVDAAPTSETLAFLDRHRVLGTPAVVATVIRTGEGSGVEVGDRLLLDQGWQPRGGITRSSIAVPVMRYAAAALRESRSCLVHLDETEVFVEWVGPPPSLVVLGAGHDVIPLVSIASELGWGITVGDGRPAYAKAERFPGADRVVLMPAADPFRNMTIDSDCAVVLMTHNYPLDRRLLPDLLQMRPRYLGLLGPKSRALRLFDEIGLDRIPTSVHAPVGLDLGSDNPASIALAIVGEIQAVIAGRSAAMLRYRDGGIHQPADEIGSPQCDPGGVKPSYCETTAETYV